MNELKDKPTKQEKDFFVSLQQNGLLVEEKSVIKKALIQEVSTVRGGVSFVFPRFFFSKPAIGMFALLLMIFAGVGVGKASENALPGEPLYGAKTALYEPVSDIFLYEDSQEKAKERIMKRLREADSLVLEDKFGGSEKKQLEILIDAEVAVLRQQDAHFSEKGLLTLLEGISERVHLMFGADGKVMLEVMVPASGLPKGGSLHEGTKEDAEERDEDGSVSGSDKEDGSHHEREGRGSLESDDEDDNEDSKERTAERKSKSEQEDRSGKESGDDESHDSEDEAEEDNSGKGSSSDDEPEEEDE